MGGLLASHPPQGKDVGKPYTLRAPEREHVAQAGRAQRCEVPHGRTSGSVLSGQKEVSKPQEAL